MNKFLLLICSCSLLIFNSCKQDENNLSTIGGYIDIKLSADSNVLESESRGVRSYTPDIGDFGLKVSKWSGEIFAQWDKFSDFRTTGVPAGKYKVEAYYGDGEEEGFDALSYYGSSQVSTGSDEIVETSVVCTINKALVSISYTDSFKDYFKSYKGYISTSKGNKVVYEDGEERSAYFVPGELDVFLEVTRDGVADTVRLNPKTFKAAARTEYRLTMDVDAGTSTLNIIFNDRPSDYKNVTINISDAVLNAEPPKFTLYGFESGKDLEILEHSEFAETLQAYLNAPAGISKCKLISNSAYLKSLGDNNWKDTLDLANLNAAEKNMVSGMELETIGLGERKDQIAVVNFNKFVSKLGCMAETNEVHRFILAATDKLSKVSDTIYFNVVTRSNQFAFAGPAEPVPYGSNSVEFDLTLEGVHDNVVFKEKSGDDFVEIDESRISIVPNAEDNLKSKVVITFDPLFDTENAYEIQAEYGGKAINVSFTVDGPKLNLSAQDFDIWATKAYVTVSKSDDANEDINISQENIEIYQKTEDGTLVKMENVAFEDGKFKIAGLGDPDSYPDNVSGVEYTIRAAYKVDDNTKLYSNEITFKTEDKSQLPNCGFEDWNKVWIWTGSSVAGGDVPIYSFLPYKNDDKCWSTNNEFTTAEVGSFSYYYVVYPAVVQFPSEWSASSKVGLINEPCSGNFSAELSVIGHGEGSTCTTGLLGNKLNCKLKTPGVLFTGYYEDGQEKLGREFLSRPFSMKFVYRFYSVNNEQASVLIKIENRNGNESIELGKGELIINEESLVNDSAEVIISYKNVELKPTHIIVYFKSSTSDNPNIVPYYVKENFQGNRYTRGIGNVFIVDNIELIY